MTNETKPKIKELIKELGRHLTSDPETIYIRQTDDFLNLKIAIKQLRKENKKLKKVLEATEFAFKMKGWGALVSEHVSQLENMWKFDGECFLFNGGGNAPEPKPQAAAHFKCAKTHKPEKDGRFGVIYLFGGILKFTSLNYESGKWKNMTYPVLAFTETDPQEIINSLSKTK